MDHSEHHGHSAVAEPGRAVPETVEGHDHSGHMDHVGMFRRRFWVSLILTVPTLVFSTGLQDILHLSGPRFPGSEWIPAVFGLAIFVYGGRTFLKDGWWELRHRQPGMMLLISLAIVVAFGYSAAVTLGLHGMDFWWELATLITIMLLGHWIEMAAVMRAGDALGELATLIPDVADVVHGDHVMSVPVSSIVVGDSVLVRPGASVPVDGEVVEGESDVNESLLTGESAAVAKISRVDGRRGQRQRLGRAHDSRDQGRRRHRPRGRDEARGRGPGEQVRGAGARRSGGRLAVLRRRRRCDHHRDRLGADPALRPELHSGARRDRARHRLPARARTRHPAGRADLHVARRPAGHPGAQPGRTRGRPAGLGRAVRQDRNPHRRPPGRRERVRDRRHDRRRAAAARGRGREPVRASDRPRDRR